MYGKSTETTYWAGLPVAAGVIEPVTVVSGVGTVEGTVTAQDGSAIAGAVVSAGGKTSTTSSLGHYSIAGVPEGNQTVSFTALGYVSKQLSVSVVSDKTSYADAILAPVASGLGTLEGTVTAQGGASIAGAFVSVGGMSATTSSQGHFIITGVTEGEHVVSFSADGYYLKKVTVSIVSDKTTYANAALAPVPPPDMSPPVTAVHGAPVGWVNHDVTLSLLASDESGVASTYCQLGNGTVKMYEGSVTVSAEGTTQFTYWSQDNAGNSEAPKAVSVRIDKTAPSLVVNVDGDGTTAALVSATAEDSLSGMANVSARVDSGDWTVATSVNVTAYGTHTVTFKARDAAGNETQKSVTVTIKCTTAESVLTKSLLAKYGSQVMLFGTLSNSAGLSMQGQSVGLARFVSGSWVPVDATAIVDSAGGFAFVLHPSDNGMYRFVYPGSDLSLPSVSDPIAVSVSAAVGTPRATANHRRLTVSGRITPAHSGGVWIYYERKVHGKYKAYTNRYASMSSKGTYSKVLSLSSGSWRVRVKHADGSHAPAFSSWRYATIR